MPHNHGYNDNKHGYSVKKSNADNIFKLILSFEYCCISMKFHPKDDAQSLK